jgi:hypothetical protein
MATAEDRAPLLAEEGGVRQRSAGTQNGDKASKRWQPPPNSDWDPDLPYGGKVYLARKKKPDSLKVKICEALLLICTFAFACYAWFYFDHLHFNVTYGYAKLGYPAAQHQVGQRYLHGKGTDKDHYEAMEWFKKAADQGHPHASYNLAVGHLQGLRTDLLAKGDPHRLIAHAASQGVKEAHKALNEICTRGGCE